MWFENVCFQLHICRHMFGKFVYMLLLIRVLLSRAVFQGKMICVEQWSLSNVLDNPHVPGYDRGEPAVSYR